MKPTKVKWECAICGRQILIKINGSLHGNLEFPGGIVCSPCLNRLIAVRVISNVEDAMLPKVVKHTSEFVFDKLGINRKYPDCVECGEDAVIIRDGKNYCQACDELINLYILRDPKGKP